eukprot:2656523-Amphidinium_carterae.1
MKEIKRLYDGFEMENYLETVKKKKGITDTENEGEKTWLQKSRTSTHYERQDMKKLKYNYIEKHYRLQRYWSSTRYHHKRLWTPGHYLAQFQRATWRTLRTTDMDNTTSARRYNTPSMTSLTDIYDFNYNSVQLTGQDYHFVVVHTRQVTRGDDACT